jgi:imidazolonepropionase-like amidohydrolase
MLNLNSMKNLLVIILFLISLRSGYSQSGETVLLKNVSVIDGTGSAAQKNVSVLIKAGKIASISKQSDAKDAKVIDLAGKTIMPLLTNVHGHLGMALNNHSHAQLLKELLRYESYGVGTVVSMGTDKEGIFSIRDSSRMGKIPGAYVYTAGYGFRAPLGTRPQEIGMEKLYRPATPEEAVRNVRDLAKLKPDFIKMWVDDMGGSTPKIQPEVYRAIIEEAHKNGIRVAAHLYYLEDAHRLIDMDVDIFAHSVRDKEMDDALIAKMKAKGTIYTPTLTRDGYEFFYGSVQPWINDPFFRAALEPGVYETITTDAYRKKVMDNPRYQKNVEAYKMALRNLKKVHDGGVLVALGTDSGAQTVRAQGFSEHLELQLMVDAGLTPLQAITASTRNACKALNVKDQGTLAPGMNADFIVLGENPENNIKATQKIESVWKNGVLVNVGPKVGRN